MKYSLGTVAILYALLVAVCLAGGQLLPLNLTWGCHSFAFLPGFIFVGYLIVLAIVVAAVYLGATDRPIEALAAFMETRPKLFLGSSILLFVVIAMLLRVRIPLLGDSFVVINNFENTFNGTHDLGVSREPFAMFYFYGIMKVLGITAYPAMMTAFLVGEILLGAGFIAMAFGIVRTLFVGARSQLFSFCFLVSIPYMQIFFGYVEIYSVELFFLSLFVLLGVLVLHGKVPFYILPPAFVMVVYAHYITALCGLSLLFIAFRVFRAGRVRDLWIGALTGAATVFAIFLSIGFRLSILLPKFPHAHYLSLRNTPDEYQAYGLFSSFHIADLLNMLILMSPWAVLLIGVALSRTRKALTVSDPARFFLLSVVPFCLFLFLAKFDLGMAKDWDISAPFFFLIACYSVVVFIRSAEGPDLRFFAVVVVVTALTSAVYFTLNASGEPAIARSKSLLDRRTLPRGGYYQSVFHLSMYYFHKGDIENMAAMWENFIMTFPDDPRGYQKKAKALWELGEPGFDRVSAVFDRWLAAGCDTVESKKEYTIFCFNAGDVYYSEREWPRALAMFEKTIRLDPALTAVYSNVGLVHARMGDPDEAIRWHRLALERDTSYAPAYRNIGRALMQKGDLSGAVLWLQNAIRHDPAMLDAYEDLAGIYYTRKEYDYSFAILRQAARLGSLTAQEILRSNNLTW